ncbi:MAG TPA: pseudouridine-5'-phosphate glycosidase [Gemmataceae bacterium]
MTGDGLALCDEVAAALKAGGPVVALESTLIAHGLPWPLNLETARATESAVREAGAVPATVGVWEGTPTLGLSPAQIEAFARGGEVRKASRRDLAFAALRRRHAATTVAATMALAHRAGIAVFATGGIGGVHPDVAESLDVSADLTELARTPVLVVCAGAKSILDLPRTLELLETLAVPVAGYRTDTFPAFYLPSSGLTVPARVDTPAEAAELFALHRKLGGAGMLLAQPVAEELAVPAGELGDALSRAESEADAAGVTGPARTPFLLARLAEITGGKTLRANRALVVANAKLAAEVAVNLSRSAGG